MLYCDLTAYQRHGGALPAGGQLVWYVSTPDPADIYSITLDFGGQVPAQIGVNAYRDGAWLGWQYFAPEQNIQTFAVAYQHITALQVNITRLRQAGQRAHLATFASGLASTGLHQAVTQLFGGLAIN